MNYLLRFDVQTLKVMVDALRCCEEFLTYDEEDEKNITHPEPFKPFGWSKNNHVCIALRKLAREYPLEHRDGAYRVESYIAWLMHGKEDQHRAGPIPNWLSNQLFRRTPGGNIDPRDEAAYNKFNTLSIDVMQDYRRRWISHMIHTIRQEMNTRKEKQ